MAKSNNASTAGATLVEAAPGPPTMQALFQAVSVDDLTENGVFAQRVRMKPVNGEKVDGTENENKFFANGEAFGSFELVVDNDINKSFFEAGAHYVIDITKLVPIVQPVQ